MMDGCDPVTEETIINAIRNTIAEMEIERNEAVDRVLAKRGYGSGTFSGGKIGSGCVIEVAEVESNYIEPKDIKSAYIEDDVIEKFEGKFSEWRVNLIAIKSCIEND